LVRGGRGYDRVYRRVGAGRCGRRVPGRYPRPRAPLSFSSREQLRARLAEFTLELHPEKTRLIEFGRFAMANRAEKKSGQTSDVQLPRLYASMRTALERWPFHGDPVDHSKAHGGEVAADWQRPDGATISTASRTRQVAGIGGAGMVGVLCRPRQPLCDPQFPPKSGRGLAAHPAQPQPNSQTRNLLGRDAEHCRPLHSPGSHYSSLSKRALMRTYLMEEPYAGNPPVRICAGECCERGSPISMLSTATGVRNVIIFISIV